MPKPREVLDGPLSGPTILRKQGSSRTCLERTAVPIRVGFERKNRIGEMRRHDPAIGSFLLAAGLIAPATPTDPGSTPGLSATRWAQRRTTMPRTIGVLVVMGAAACILGGCGGGGGGGVGEGVLSFVQSSFSVNEDGSVVVAVTVQRAGGSGAVGATITLSNGTAVAPGDFDATPIVVSWAAGDTADKIVVVPIVDDHDDEPDETVNLSLGSPTGGAVIGFGVATLTIIDDDVAGAIEFVPGSYFYNESGATVLHVTVRRVGGIDGIVSATMTSEDDTANSDPLSVVEPVDYLPVSVIVTFPDQDATDIVVDLSAHIVQDVLPEVFSERFRLVLSAPSNGAVLGASSVETVSILDDDPMLEIPNPSGDITGFFGSSVAKVGARLAVGAPGNIQPAGQVFVIDPSVPSVVATLPSPPFAQHFGMAVAPHGVDLLVGAAGSAWLYDDATWTASLSLTSPLDGFGQSMISLEDGRFVIGAPLAQPVVGANGALEVYDELTGALLQTLVGQGMEGFASAFARSGSHLFVGAPGGPGTVHRYSGNPLSLDLVIENPFPNPSAPSPGFGKAVAVLGDAIIVGAPDEDTFAPNDGRAYIFDGSSVTAILAAELAFAGGRFGSVITTVGDRICVQKKISGPFASGRVFVYTSDGVVHSIVDDPSPAPGADFGASMCEFDGVLVVGAPKQPAVLQSGSVFIIRL
jgi:hypothetical protein